MVMVMKMMMRTSNGSLIINTLMSEKDNFKHQNSKSEKVSGTRSDCVHATSVVQLLWASDVVPLALLLLHLLHTVDNGVRWVDWVARPKPGGNLSQSSLPSELPICVGGRGVCPNPDKVVVVGDVVQTNPGVRWHQCCHRCVLGWWEYTHKKPPPVPVTLYETPCNPQTPSGTLREKIWCWDMLRFYFN